MTASMMSSNDVQRCINAADARVPDTTYDAGRRWLAAFHAEARRLGYRVEVGAPCCCRDGGEYGHLPQCGYVKG